MRFTLDIERLFVYTGGVPANLVALALLAGVMALALLWYSRRRDHFRGNAPVHVVTAPLALNPRRWRWESLTAREVEIAERIARGERPAEVAAVLSISHYTVETHLKHIYSKLDVHSRLQLARALREFVDV